MSTSNMAKNQWPTSEAPVKSRTHSPNCQQAEKQQRTHNSSYMVYGARESIWTNGYDIFSNIIFKQCNGTCRSVEQAPGLYCWIMTVVLPWEKVLTWKKAHCPLISAWFPLERGHKLCSLWEGTGVGCPMLRECEDCGVCMVLEGERLRYGSVHASWKDTAYWKTCVCPRLCRRLGCSMGRVGEEGAVRNSRGSHPSSASWGWWQTFPTVFSYLISLENTLSPSFSCFACWSSPSNYQPAPGRCWGLQEAAACLHSKTTSHSKARCQSIPTPELEGQIRTRVTQPGKIVTMTSNRQYEKTNVLMIGKLVCSMQRLYYFNSQRHMYVFELPSHSTLCSASSSAFILYSTITHHPIWLVNCLWVKNGFLKTVIQKSYVKFWA